MRKKFIFVLCVILLLSCGNNVNVNRVDEGNTIVFEDTVNVQQVENFPTRFEPYKPQLWIDNFLSNTQKDTLTVCLWSGLQNRYLDSIPIDTTMDWWVWYQQNNVAAVLFLKDVKPIHINYSHWLYYCAVLRENGKRAIAIVPGACQPSNCNVCSIYTIKDKKWQLLHQFSILSSFLYSENGEEHELTRKWLVKHNGRWMYKDCGDYLADVDTTYYVFAKPLHQEVTGWQFEYMGKQYPAKVPGFIQDDLKRNGLLAAGQNEDWIREKVWSYHTSINLKDFPDNRRFLVIDGLAGVGEYYVSYSGEETGGVHGYFNYVTSNDTFDISYPIERLDVEIIFNRSIAEKVDPRYDIPMADRKAFAKAVSRQDNWRWGQPLPQWGIWRGVFVTN